MNIKLIQQWIQPYSGKVWKMGSEISVSSDLGNELVENGLAKEIKILTQVIKKKTKK